MLILYCTRDGCPNKTTGWEYTGKKHYPGLVSCSYCGYKIRIPKTEGV